MLHCIVLQTDTEIFQIVCSWFQKYSTKQRWIVNRFFKHLKEPPDNEPSRIENPGGSSHHQGQVIPVCGGIILWFYFGFVLVTVVLKWGNQEQQQTWEY